MLLFLVLPASEACNEALKSFLGKGQTESENNHPRIGSKTKTPNSSPVA